MCFWVSVWESETGELVCGVVTTVHTSRYRGSGIPTYCVSTLRIYVVVVLNLGLLGWSWGVAPKVSRELEAFSN